MNLTTRTKLLGWLMLGAGAGGAAVVPYQMALMPAAFESVPMSVGALMLVSGLQVAVLAGILSGVGLWAAGPLGLGAPMLERWLEGQPPRPGPLLGLGLGGVVAGFVVAVVDAGLLLPLLPEPAIELGQPSPFVALGASLYGAIVEEVLLRLFFLTVIAWLVSWPARRAGRPVGVAVVVGIVVSALLFGLGHLPAAATLWPLTPPVVARVVGLNLVLGVAFGAIYARRGLGAAMVAHFGADLGLHVLSPLVLS